MCRESKKEVLQVFHDISVGDVVGIGRGLDI